MRAPFGAEAIRDFAENDTGRSARSEPLLVAGMVRLVTKTNRIYRSGLVAKGDAAGSPLFSLNSMSWIFHGKAGKYFHT